MRSSGGPELTCLVCPYEYVKGIDEMRRTADGFWKVRMADFYVRGGEFRPGTAELSRGTWEEPQPLAEAAPEIRIIDVSPENTEGFDHVETEPGRFPSL